SFHDIMCYMDHYYAQQIAASVPALTDRYEELAGLAGEDPGVAVMLEELAEYITYLAVGMSQHGARPSPVLTATSLPATSLPAGTVTATADATLDDPVLDHGHDNDAALREIHACLAVIDEIASDEEDPEGYAEMIFGAFVDKITPETLKIIGPFFGGNTLAAIEGMY
ncbi:MAG: hypothetical protein ACYDGY_03755, partial [Acidimicrobiales bacterium]